MSQSSDAVAVAAVVSVSPVRNSSERPVYKLSVKLIDTYKHINKIYYEAKAKRLREQQDITRGGVHNEGYDDQNYDYILHDDEIFNERYIIKHRVGKGSFGQVVCAYDQDLRCEVAIKIIKSRRPFLVQAQTEIEILSLMTNKDPDDEFNVVKLLDSFVYRNHQCLVFEMLSYNLYDLLRNTKFKGISLNLIRKFSKQILKSLSFLASPEVNVIHCDLKPENILLRHPRRSNIKLIDFGSSCYLTKRTYTYIQSRFYRSPEILLGLPYDQKIDIWSLGCVLVEMHTGEPLFGGADEVDQMCRIVHVLGMPSATLLDRVKVDVRNKFFERIELNSGVIPSSDCDTNFIAETIDRTAYYILKKPSNRDLPRPRTLAQILGVYTGGPGGRKIGEPGHTTDKYVEFLDFISKLLVYIPSDRTSADDALNHPYLSVNVGGPPEQQSQPAPAAAVEHAASQPVTGNGFENTGNVPTSDEAANARGRLELTQSHDRIRSRSAPSNGGFSQPTTRMRNREKNNTNENG